MTCESSLVFMIISFDPTIVCFLRAFGVLKIDPLKTIGSLRTSTVFEGFQGESLIWTQAEAERLEVLGYCDTYCHARWV